MSCGGGVWRGGRSSSGGGPFVRSRFWRSFDSTGNGQRATGDGGRQGTHPRRAHTHRVRVEGIKVLGVLRYVGYVCMYLYGCWDVLYFYVLCMDVCMYVWMDGVWMDYVWMYGCMGITSSRAQNNDQKVEE